MRATVTELNKPHRSFQFFSARAGKNIDTTSNTSGRCIVPCSSEGIGRKFRTSSSLDKLKRKLFE